ncbi:hypothetical protein HDU97_005772 [Phlyctochytrium planicorne]|nr:hypothetical protein HDU97_005772 [Phlyctochytrium planicorne]
MTDDPSNSGSREFLNFFNCSSSAYCQDGFESTTASGNTADLLTSASPARRVHSAALTLFVVAEVDPG